MTLGPDGRMAAHDGPDLGELFSRIARRLLERERPLLEARGITMWQYAVLTCLARRPASTQLELASAIRYDKTRLIGLLDELEAKGLVRREPDPADRRARIVQITAKGRRRHAAAMADIRAMEDGLLSALTAEERAGLRSALARLAFGATGDAQAAP
jgi:DNA-binding MarR family transcriptional regulator